jgi:hypothetical protein
MRDFARVSPTDTRLASRLPEAHITPTVIRELPRPIPQGLGSTVW